MDDPRENRDSDYPCTQCDKKYGTLGRLSEHMQGAHGEPRYSCELCLQKFAWRTGLMRHRPKCPNKMLAEGADDGKAQIIDKYLV